jgi:hypothetical protein
MRKPQVRQATVLSLRMAEAEQPDDAEITFEAYIKDQRDNWTIPVQCHSEAWSESLCWHYHPIDRALELSF